MTRPRPTPSKRGTKSSKGRTAPAAGKGSSLKDLALGIDRPATAGTKGGRRTTVKDSNDKYA